MEKFQLFCNKVHVSFEMRYSIIILYREIRTDSVRFLLARKVDLSCITVESNSTFIYCKKWFQPKVSAEL